VASEVVTVGVVLGCVVLRCVVWCCFESWQFVCCKLGPRQTHNRSDTINNLLPLTVAAALSAVTTVTHNTLCH